MTFPGALDSKKAVVYTALLEEYAEAVRVQDLALTEARQHNGVVDPEILADVDVAREAVQARLISPEMVEVVQLGGMVRKAVEELKRQQQQDRRNGVTAPTSYVHPGRHHNTHAFEYIYIAQNDEWSPSEKTSTIASLLIEESERDVVQCFVGSGKWSVEFFHFEGPPDWDVVCKKLLALLPYRADIRPAPTQPSLRAEKFFKAVPAFISAGSAAGGRRAQVHEEMVVDGTEISMLRSKLNEATRRIEVLQQHLRTSQIGWLVSSQQMDACDELFDMYDDLFLTQDHALQQSEVIADFVDEDARHELDRNRSQVLRQLAIVGTMRYPDAGMREEQKPPIPTEEQRDVAIQEGCFEKGGQFKGYRRGKAGDEEEFTGPQHGVAVMAYDSRADWPAAFKVAGSPPNFTHFVEVLAVRNRAKHPTAVRPTRDPALSGKENQKKERQWSSQVDWLKVLLNPMLFELGLRVRSSHRRSTQRDVSDYLVDHGILLDKNGEFNVHGKRLGPLTLRQIKVHIQNGREECCAICRKSFTFLAEEAYRKKKCLQAWAALYPDFMECDHRRGRPCDCRLEGIDNVCIPCHYLKSRNLPPFHLCYGYEAFFQD